MPSWTWINEDNHQRTLDEEYKITPLLDATALELTEMQRSDEQMRWQWEVEDDYQPDDTDGLYRTIYTRRRIGEYEALYAILAEHGARLMRPYEHWNEGEAYMEYTERDRR